MSIAVEKSIGIMQSRGLGDIIIALPIAKSYYDEGYEVWWAVCDPFYEQMRRAAPWVKWLSVPVDPAGDFFYNNPKQQYEALGVREELWLYQYLSSHPERTVKSHFAQFKFDQYKYAQAEVPFGKKWELDQCIERDHDREQALYDRVVTKPRYMVYQGTASDLSYDIDLSIIDPEVECIELTDLTDSVFDWLKVLEGAETMIFIDSVFANLVDQLKINPDCDKYYMRKWNRRVDGNPVLLSNWTFVEIADPEGMAVRSIADTGLQQNPATGPAGTQPKPQSSSGSGNSETYTPYGKTDNTMNAAQRLQAQLGLRR
jgi:hypothetical protein